MPRLLVLRAGLWIVTALACGCADALPAADRVGQVVEGRVTDAAGAPLGGVFVTLRPEGAPLSHTRVTDRHGRWSFFELAAGRYAARVHRPGLSEWTGEASVPASAGDVAEVRLEPVPVGPAEASSSAYLELLPDDAAKRRFILDCTGCHVLDDRIAFPGGLPRTEADWFDAVGRMLGFAGPRSAFPVIGHGHEPGSTAAYLAEHLGGRAGRVPQMAAPPLPDVATAGALITEYEIPEPADLPHDVAIDSAGRILITGMFTHRMYVLDPASGAFETVPIPVQNANPRAVELGPDGAWWVLLGAPQQVARYDPATRDWSTHAINVYGHSIGVDSRGRAWFNGHFTRDPILLGHIDPATGDVRTVEVPAHPMVPEGGNPIPYELRLAPDGTVWVSELAGNRVIGFDPDDGSFSVHELPTPHAGPRRLDIGADGAIWIPQYANNTLARLDPATGALLEWPLPIPDAAPYVARVDQRSGLVWLGTGAADALLSFDPRTENFTVYGLPTRGALVRHIAIDPRNGEVWAAYGASPGIPSKVARLRPGEPR